MFLNRKLIVQLSTSRFRPQPKEMNNFLSKPLINQGTTPSTSMSYPHLNNPNDGGTNGSSSTLALTQFSSLDVNFDAMTNFNAQHSSPLTGANNYFSTNFRPPSPPFHNSSQDITSAFYSPYHSLPPIDRMTPSPLSMPSNKFNPMMKSTKTGSFLFFCF